MSLGDVANELLQQQSVEEHLRQQGLEVRRLRQAEKVLKEGLRRSERALSDSREHMQRNIDQREAERALLQAALDQMHSERAELEESHARATEEGRRRHSAELDGLRADLLV